MKISNHWKRAVRTFPIIGILALIATGCGTTKKLETGPVTDPQIAASVKGAQAAYESGGFVRAARYYELALARARALDDGEEIGRNAYNAAACWLRAGVPENARPLLVEAEREFTRNKLDLDPVIVLKTKVAAAVGEYENAAALASNALANAKSDKQKFDALMLQFDQAFLRGDAVKASALAEKAGRAAHDLGLASARAGSAAAAGKVFLMQSKAGDAAERFDRAAELWSNAGNIREMALNLRAAGDAFSAAGKSADSADRLYRAARSFFGQNDNVTALQCIEAALKSADAAKDDVQREQIAALFGQIKKSVEGPRE